MNGEVQSKGHEHIFKAREVINFPAGTEQLNVSTHLISMIFGR